MVSYPMKFAKSCVRIGSALSCFQWRGGSLQSYGPIANKLISTNVDWTQRVALLH